MCLYFLPSARESFCLQMLLFSVAGNIYGLLTYFEIRVCLRMEYELYTDQNEDIDFNEAKAYSQIMLLYPSSIGVPALFGQGLNIHVGIIGHVRAE